MKNQKKRERLTCQKKIILDYLKSVKTHPSAETLYLSVRKKLPQISLGTVYRILKNLKDKGEIREIPDEVSRYEGDLTPHAHFICEDCRKIFDVFEKCHILQTKKIKVGKMNYPAPKGGVSLRASSFGGFTAEIKNYQVYFYGHCKNCQR